MDLLATIGISTGIYAFMNTAWGWPFIESVHFLGLCLLIGAVGLFDLRMLGIARGIPLEALHKLVPVGVLGFAINVTSGFMFLVSAPDQYLFNPAFQMKMLFMALAGVNMLLFYRVVYAAVKQTGDEALPPRLAMIMGAVSLTCWTLVISFGRLITVFRPPYHWCWWC
jgi:hypothetical protein